MAFKIGSLKLPLPGRRGCVRPPGRRAERAPAGAPSTPGAAPGSGSAMGRLLSAPLPFVGRFPVARQLQLFTALLVALLAIDAAIVAVDNRQGTFAHLYIASVGKIQMLSQRLAKAAQQASQGNREAFKQLRESRNEFAGLVRLLGAGGTHSGVELPPTPERLRPQLQALEREWRKTERNAELVIGEERNLVALGEAVRLINANNPTLLELADEIAALSVQGGGSVRQNAVTSQLVMLTQRMAKNANTVLAGDVVDPEVAFLLGKDTNTFRELLQGLLHGNDSVRIVRVADAEMRGKLGELESGFKEYQGAVSAILGNMQRLVNAKRATRDIFNDS
jgi:twitching motility protein PilJ